MKLQARLLIAACAAGMAAAQTAPPVITMLSPATAAAGSPGFVLTVLGGNFTPGCVVWWAGYALPTSYLSPTHLTANVSASLLATPSSPAIAVQSSGGIWSAGRTFTVTNRPVSILTEALPPGSVGSAYSAQFSASGAGPFLWGIQAGTFPAGLTLSSGGVISGSPIAAGSYSFTVRVADAMQSTAVRSLVLVVNPPPLSISTSSPLPPPTVGVAYSQTFAALSGSPPYVWAIRVESAPPGFSLNSSTGVLSGTPAAAGTYTFDIQVRENSGAVATKSFQLAVRPAPLSITTDVLFNGVAGSEYSQTFSASGGVPPYNWTLTGAVGDLRFDSSTGTLSGTPREAGTHTLLIQVNDSAGGSASRSFNLIVDLPRIAILNAPALPTATVGAGYSHRFSAVGGVPPYRWWISSGSAPGLSLDSAAGTLSGVPRAAGAFSLVVQVSDSASQIASKTFTFSVNPAPLVITTPARLSPAIVAAAASFQIEAEGGSPPYRWSANGLPEGLEIDAERGSIGGVAKSPGTFVFTVRVTDSGRASAVELFHLNIGLPEAPTLVLQGLPPMAAPAEQIALQLRMESAYPVALDGRLNLSFTPDAGAGDPAVQFATGGRSVSFTIPSGSTGITIPELAIQTGTVAGIIRVEVQLLVGGADIAPNLPPLASSRVERAAPAIRAAKVSRNGSTLGVQIAGFCTAREITEAVFRFKAPGNDLRSTEVTVAIEDLFARYFQDPAMARTGSQFVFTQPFTVQGDIGAVQLDSVVLKNRLGSSTATPSP